METNAGPDNQQETSTSSRRQEATKYLPYAASALAVFIYLPGSSVFERIILGAIGGIFLNGILLIGYLSMLHFVRWVGHKPVHIEIPDPRDYRLIATLLLAIVSMLFGGFLATSTHNDKVDDIIDCVLSPTTPNFVGSKERAANLVRFCAK